MLVAKLKRIKPGAPKPSPGITATFTKYLYLNGITFTNCSRCIDTSHSYIELLSSTIGDGNTNGFRATEGGKIRISSTTQTGDGYISGTLYDAEDGGKIYKPVDMIGNSAIPRTTGLFEVVSGGGACIGAFGEDGEVIPGTNYDINIDSTSDATTLTTYLKTFGTIVPKNLDLRIRFLDTEPIPTVTRTFSITEPIEIDSMEGGGQITIETQNGDYGNMEIVNAGVVFDIKNCKCNVNFGDLTVKSSGTGNTDHAIQVTNCDNFIINTANELYVEADGGYCIKFEKCKLIDTFNLHVKHDATGVNDRAIYVSDCAHASIVSTTFDCAARYVYATSSNVSVYNSNDTLSPTSALDRFQAINGSEIILQGEYEFGLGSIQDLLNHIDTDQRSCIKGYNNAVSQSFMEIGDRATSW